MKFPKFKPGEVVRIDTLLGRRAEVQGDITGKGNFKIDGRVEGSVRIQGDLITGEKSFIRGDVSARNLIIAGEIAGNIEALGQLTIKHTGVVNGQHKSASLIVEEGSKFTGNCEITGTAAEEPADEAPAEEEEQGDA